MGNKISRIGDGQQKYRMGDGQAMLNGLCAGAAPLAGYKAGHWCVHHCPLVLVLVCSIVHICTGVLVQCALVCTIAVTACIN